MLVGPIINSVATLMGAILGVVFGSRIPRRLKTMLPLTFAALSMSMGVVMLAKVNLLPAVILAMLLGSIVGELLAIERRIEQAAARVNRFLTQRLSFKPSTLPPDEFMSGFVSVLVLFSASGTGIFGAMTEGITHDSTILVSKSFLDFFTALIFATSLGVMVATTVVPQFIILVSLYFLGGLIMPYTTPELVADFSACGGVIMLANGFRIANIRAFPVANMLPALLLVMSISHYWRVFFAG